MARRALCSHLNIIKYQQDTLQTYSLVLFMSVIATSRARGEDTAVKHEPGLFRVNESLNTGYMYTT